MSAPAQVTRVLLAVLWWARLCAPTRIAARFNAAMARHQIDGDLEKAILQLPALLGPLHAEQQRRLVYQVVRETFGIEPPIWDEAAAIAMGSHRWDGHWMVPTQGALDLVTTDDDTMWFVLAHAATACAARTPGLVDLAAAARSQLHVLHRPGDHRRALAALLGGDREQSAWMREVLGCESQCPLDGPVGNVPDRSLGHELGAPLGFDLSAWEVEEPSPDSTERMVDAVMRELAKKRSREDR